LGVVTRVLWVRWNDTCANVSVAGGGSVGTVLVWSTLSTTYSTCNGEDRHVSPRWVHSSLEVRSSCIMGELEVELKRERERETIFHCRHVDGLGLGATLNIIFGLFYWLMHHVKEDRCCGNCTLNNIFRALM
jgi:hypothetical protein